MVIDLKFARFENVPWGFRLIGGADFEVPLTVVKVTEGSLAEQAGLKVGDVIVRINDEPTSPMTHSDAHSIILRAGNHFFFGVLRENEEPENQNVNELQENFSRPHSYTPNSMKDSLECKTPVSDTIEKPSEEIHQQNITTSIDGDQHNTDDEIAELMSGEAEVLKEHNTIGVNFYRIFPKSGVCMSSEVLRTLNDESVKTENEKELDKRKWTTFLQKPNRPVPKSKKELEEEAKIIPYKVAIVKQPKPRVAPDRPPSPPPIPVIEPEPELQIQQEPPKEIIEPLPTDSEIPNLEPVAVIKSEIQQNEIIEQSYESKYELSEIISEEKHVEHQIQTTETAVSSVVETIQIQKTEEEIILEKQLADVQKQLLALSSLPSTIQATLDSVTRQLSELLPAFKLQTNPVPCEIEKKISTEEASRKDKETAEMMKLCQDRITKLAENKILEIPNIPPPPTAEQIHHKKQEQEQQLLQDELAYKKQKEQNLITELEQKQRTIREQTPRKSKRLFGPLTPQERPLVLPGGRKWRKPKDAFNDEFIAEVLSSQAELITGTTLGVNFLKYQKPEKKIDLEKSEVYKIIHHMDGEPKRGIETRPPKVIAEEDVRRCATPSPTPITCN